MLVVKYQYPFTRYSSKNVNCTRLNYLINQKENSLMKSKQQLRKNSWVHLISTVAMVGLTACDSGTEQSSTTSSNVKSFSDVLVRAVYIHLK